MSLKDGHYKTKRKEGTRNCFYCRRDVTEWQPLTWPQIKAIFEHCKLQVPTALCCNDCYRDKPHEQLYEIFWGVVVANECENFLKKRPSIIKDKATYDLMFAKLRNSSAVEEAKKFIEEHK